MTQRWLDILDQSGDDHVGQTLVRLAHLAEAVHRFQTVQPLLDSHAEDRQRLEGLEPQTVVFRGRQALDRRHTEVEP